LNEPSFKTLIVWVAGDDGAMDSNFLNMCAFFSHLMSTLGKWVTFLEA